MIGLIDMCQLGWLPVFLSWILPFLLGIMLGWVLWGVFKTKFYDHEKELVKYKERVHELDADFQGSQKARTQLEGEAAILRGRIRELEAALRSSQRKVGEAQSPPQPKRMQPVIQVTGRPQEKGSAPAKEVHFQLIEGIGPAIESILKRNGIDSLSKIAESSAESLKQILLEEDAKLRLVDTGSWPVQARLAVKGLWAELKDLQRELNSQTAGESHRLTKADQYLINSGIQPKYQQDDMQAIQGIGPAIAEVLAQEGISSWDALAQTDVAKLQAILDSYGDRFRFADPITWPVQAGLASTGAWEELEKLQSNLS